MMTMVSQWHHVETFQNEPDLHGSGVREDVAGAQVQRSESLGKLAGRVAHDINNILTVITGFSAFVAEDINAAQRDGCAHLPNASADLEKILTAARRGRGLTNQLMSFEDHQVTRTDVTDLDNVITSVVELLQQTVEKHIQVVLDSNGEPHPVLVDPVSLERALLNLAVNAHDAISTRGTQRKRRSS
ncbi:hypothetical protein [Actinophytocola sp.]|uniref:sensor histidine kinase n=1 Tax=Actinophytocola sp. TaxID=1872138 RepID=UPI002ED6A35D